MVDKKAESKIKLTLKDLVSDADIDSAVNDWSLMRIKKYGDPLVDQKAPIVKRLVAEIFLPAMSRHEYVGLMKNSGLPGDELYEDIMEGFSKKKRIGINKAAYTVAHKLATVAKLSETNTKLKLSGYVVAGDPEMTGRMGSISGTDPFIWDPSSNPKGSGYVEDPRSDY